LDGETRSMVEKMMVRSLMDEALVMIFDIVWPAAKGNGVAL
jgi:hypothetical protein